MKSFKEFILESIEKADLKKHPELKDWIKSWNRTRYKDLFQEYSTGNYKLDSTKTRIYFPLEKKDSNEVKQEIVDFLESKGYFVVDYLKGDVRTKKNTNTKIEVLLNSLKEPELKLKYQADIKERKLDNYYVVISRNPYDIAGMSIRRKWSAASCMNMDHPSLGKKYAVKHLPNDIEQGSLVVYLIRSEDRFIKNPLIRVTIRPYMASDNDESKIVFGAGTKLYLSDNDNIASKNKDKFAEAVKNWIIDVHSKQELDDVFELKPGLYDREAVSKIVLIDYNKHGKVKNGEQLKHILMSVGVNQDLNQLDVSSVTDMNDMFFNSKFNGDISAWNVSKVTNMRYMFFSSQFNQDISNWNVSKVTNMEYMFFSSQFNQDISSWDVSNVTKLEGMFFDSALSKNKTLFKEIILAWRKKNPIFNDIILPGE